MSDYGKRWESSRGVCPDCGFGDPSKGHKCPAGPVKKVPSAEYQRGYAEGVKAERGRVVGMVHSWAEVQEEDADDSDEAEHCANVLRAFASAVADVTPREAEEGKGT